MRNVLFVLIVAAVAGCSFASEPSTSSLIAHTTPGDAGDAGSASAEAGAQSAVGPVSLLSILTAIGGGAYRTSPAFVRVTRAQFASTASPGSYVEEWVSAEARDAFAAISPTATGSHATVAAGTIIVREVRDAKGTVQKLTLMAKGPPGYNPALGDWWFGVTDPQGIPQWGDDGELTGHLTQCYSCHVPRSEDDYLFGVSAESRANP